MRARVSQGWCKLGKVRMQMLTITVLIKNYRTLIWHHGLTSCCCLLWTLPWADVGWSKFLRSATFDVALLFVDQLATIGNTDTVGNAALSVALACPSLRFAIFDSLSTLRLVWCSFSSELMKIRQLHCCLVLYLELVLQRTRSLPLELSKLMWSGDLFCEEVTFSYLTSGRNDLPLRRGVAIRISISSTGKFQFWYSSLGYPGGCQGCSSILVNYLALNWLLRLKFIVVREDDIRKFFLDRCLQLVPQGKS